MWIGVFARGCVSFGEFVELLMTLAAKAACRRKFSFVAVRLEVVFGVCNGMSAGSVTPVGPGTGAGAVISGATLGCVFIAGASDSTFGSMICKRCSFNHDQHQPTMVDPSCLPRNVCIDA